MNTTATRATALMLLLGGSSVAVAAELEEILVVGARLPRPVQDVVGSVDVISRAALLDALAVNTADLVRYTPGISVVDADNRFAATEFTIRGLSGNRITSLIDGVPVADQFDIGAFSNAGQDYLTADAISRIEILRGPASTLFGSDALGGVVAVVTRDPEEYLDGRDVRLAGSAGYSGADHARVLNGSLAAASGPIAGVLHTSVLNAGERDAAGTSIEDPLDRRRGSASFKLRYDLPSGDTLRFKAEALEEEITSRPEAVLGYSRQFRNTTALRGDDERRRVALQLDYEFDIDGVWAEGGRVNLHGQRSRTRQHTAERRDLLEPAQIIERTFDYRYDDVGALLDLESRFDHGGFSHRLGWGLGVRHSQVEERRDGVLRIPATGVVSGSLLGETMPVRDFPNSTVTEMGVYLHDEITRGAFTLIPAMRLESYRLNARADALYRMDNPDTPVEDVSETALAPKLGLQWRVAEGADLFAQYARGFRAPPFEDVNIGLDIPQQNIRAEPNPDLKSETSDGIEVGLRRAGAHHALKLTLFGANYRNFTESKVNLGPEPTTGVQIFQSQNIAHARVYGAEASLELNLADTLDLEMAAAWTRGEDRDTGRRLTTVDPASLVTRLHWQPASWWAATLAVTSVAAQSSVDDGRVELFEPDGYVVVDLMAHYQPRDGVRVGFGVFNLANKTYWRWGSVRGRPVDDPRIEVLAAPERYAALSLHLGL